MRRPPLNRLPLALGLLLATAPAFAAMQAKPVEWKVGKERFSGYVVYDDASTAKRPGLVMVPNWMGVTADSVERAKAVAGKDYVVLVADVYGKGNRPKDAGEAGMLAGGLRGDDRSVRQIDHADCQLGQLSRPRFAFGEAEQCQPEHHRNKDQQADQKKGADQQGARQQAPETHHLP